MQGTSDEREQDPAVALMLATVRMIRNWVESSFSSTESARIERKGHLKARFKVELSPEMWKELQNFVKASFALSGLQLTKLERGDEKSCIEVVMSMEARKQFAAKNPAVQEKPEKHCDGSEGAEGIRTPEASQPRSVREAVPTPCKHAQGTAKRHASTCDPMPGMSKRSKTKESEPGKAAKSWMPLSDVSAHDVPCDLTGIVAAKDGLTAALTSKDLHEAVAWLKGLGRREVLAHELEKTRIGITVNDCRKQGDSYVTKLADILIQRHFWGL